MEGVGSVMPSMVHRVGRAPGHEGGQGILCPTPDILPCCFPLCDLSSQALLGRVPESLLRATDSFTFTLRKLLAVPLIPLHYIHRQLGANSGGASLQPVKEHLSGL